MELTTARKLADLNRRFYEDHAIAFAHPRAAPQPGVRRILAMIPGGATVLELGCGDGKAAQALAAGSQIAAYLGPDLSPALLERARKVTGDEQRATAPRRRRARPNPADPRGAPQPRRDGRHLELAIHAQRTAQKAHRPVDGDQPQRGRGRSPRLPPRMGAQQPTRPPLRPPVGRNRGATDGRSGRIGGDRNLPLRRRHRRSGRLRGNAKINVNYPPFHPLTKGVPMTKYVESPLESGGSILIESPEEPQKGTSGFARDQLAKEAIEKAQQSLDPSFENVRKAAG